MDPLQDIQNQIATLRQQLNMPINLDTGVAGMFEVVSSVPTGVPRSLFEQIKIYTTATTYRLYWYDWVNHAWR